MLRVFPGERPHDTTTSAVAPAPEPGPQPSTEEVHDYARYIGMDPLAEPHLLWIAEEALVAPLPPGWTEHYDEQDEPYYHVRHHAAVPYVWS
jgi:hypothetical protein